MVCYASLAGWGGFPLTYKKSNLSAVVTRGERLWSRVLTSKLRAFVLLSDLLRLSVSVITILVILQGIL